MSKAKCMRLAAELGVELTDDDEIGAIDAWAPWGKTFAADGGYHMLSGYGYDAFTRGMQGDKASAWADMAERLAHGLDDATEEETADREYHCDEVRPTS